MTEKNKKALFICAALFIGSYIVRYIVVSTMQMSSMQRQRAEAARRQARPKVPPKILSVAPGTPVAISPNAPPSAALPASFIGVWKNREALSGKGLCDLAFDVREKQGEPHHFDGYFVMTCLSFGPIVPNGRATPRARTLDHQHPEAAILSGEMENGSLQFHVDKVASADALGCSPVSFSLTPFANGLAAEWQEDPPTCPGGNMLLGKGRR